MIRLLMFLLGKEYETCKSCETLKLQLKLANEEKERLTETLLGLIQPKLFEAPPQEIQNFKPVALTWSRRKAELEMQDRIKASAMNSPYRAKPDDTLNKINENKPQTVEEIEKELGVANE